MAPSSIPIYFIHSNGRLTSSLMYFLYHTLGLSETSLSDTVWKSDSDDSLSLIEKIWCRMTRLHSRMNASVMGKRVFYKNIQRSPWDWLYLIAHEQVHRHDIDAHMLFYLSYGIQGINKSYIDISWEKRAFSIASLQPFNQKDQLSRIIQEKEHVLIEIFQSDISEQKKIEELSKLFH